MGRPELVIVGAGGIGCACARALQRSGRSVLVIDPGDPGAEASNAAAGLLAPLAESHEPGPFFDLLRLGAAEFPALARDLHDETGIDVEYRDDGILEVALTAAEEAHLRDRARSIAERGLHVEGLEAREAAIREPHLSREVRFALLLPQDHRVDNVRLTQALHRSAMSAGAEFRLGAPVTRIHEAPNAVEVLGEWIVAREIVIAAGAFSGLIDGALPRPDAVSPARGQMVALEMPGPLIRQPIKGTGAYLVPRDDGHLLVGANVEAVGFDRSVTAAGVRGLLDAAERLVPEVASCRFRTAWAGLRPRSIDGRPILGRARAGLILATGHFRNGILLAPITARIVSALVTGDAPPVALEPFSPDRLRATPARGQRSSSRPRED